MRSGQQVGGYAAHGGAAVDFFGCGVFGGQKCPVAVGTLAPLVERAGYVHPEPGLPFRHRERCEGYAAGVFDGGTGVAESVGGADLVEDDVGGSANAVHRALKFPPSRAAAR